MDSAGLQQGADRLTYLAREHGSGAWAIRGWRGRMCTRSAVRIFSDAGQNESIPGLPGAVGLGVHLEIRSSIGDWEVCARAQQHRPASSTNILLYELCACALGLELFLGDVAAYEVESGHPALQF